MVNRPNVLLVFLLLSAIAICRMAYANDAMPIIDILVTEYHPYQGVDAERFGIQGQIAKQAFAKSGYDVKFIGLPHRRQLNEIIAGNAIAAIGSRHNIESPDKPVIYHGAPTLYARAIFVYDERRHPEGIDFEHLSTLKGKFTVGTYRDAGWLPTLQEAGLTVLTTDDQERLYRMLVQGRFDLLACLDLASLRVIERSLPQLRPHLKTTQSWMNIPADLLFSKKHPHYQEARMAYEEGIAAMAEDGSLMKIFQEFYRDMPIPEDSLPPILTH